MNEVSRTSKDLVAKLRNWYHDEESGLGDAALLMGEAAAVIERLQDALRTAIDSRNAWSYPRTTLEPPVVQLEGECHSCKTWVVLRSDTDEAHYEHASVQLPRSNTEGEVGLAADVGPGGGASASASGETHAPELSPETLQFLKDALWHAVEQPETFDRNQTRQELIKIEGGSRPVPPPAPVLGTFWANLAADGQLRRYGDGEPIIFTSKGEFADEAAARNGGRVAMVEVRLAPTKPDEDRPRHIAMSGICMPGCPACSSEGEPAAPACPECGEDCLGQGEGR